MSISFHWVILDGVLLFFGLGWIYYRWALAKVTYERHFSKAIAFEGEQIEMVERIANRKLLPIPWLRLESFLSRDLVFGKQANLDIYSGELYQNHLSLFSLRPYRQIVRRHEVLCRRRGHYHLTSVTMTAGDPLGLFRTSRQFPLSVELLVYPGVLPLDQIPLPFHGLLGELLVRRWIADDPFLVSGVRDYQPGDSLRTVNWKASARSGSLQVHRRDQTTDLRLVICLNVETSGAMWGVTTDPERIELGIRYAATIAGMAIRKGVPTGIMSNGRIDPEIAAPLVLPMRGGAVQYEAILTALAKLHLKSAANMAYLLDKEAALATAKTDYLLISCHRDEKLREAAERLKQLGHGVEWLMLPETRGGDDLAV
jgi:uncharacterized protein (DUF58 family)